MRHLSTTEASIRIAQLAHVYVSPATLTRWARAKILTATHTAKGWKLRADEIDDLIAAALLQTAQTNKPQ